MKTLFSFKISYIIFGAITVLCVGLLGLVLLTIGNIRFATGSYSIEQVIVSNDLKDPQTVTGGIVFQPSDTIFCTVRTKGVDGPVGVRWFIGDELLSEGIGKTKNNLISTYIEQNSPNGLPEGSYHIEIFIADGQPIETVYFEVNDQTTP